MKRVGTAIEAALFGPESPARLWIVHTGLAILIGLRCVFGPYRGLDPTPDGLFRPPPFLVWLPEMPSAAVILAVQIAAGIATVLFVMRRWPRATFAGAWLAYVFLAGLRDSRGKVMHNDVLLILASAPFVFAPLTADKRDRESDARCGWPVRVGITVVALAYFFAGYWKIMRSGLSWVFSDNVRLSIAWGPKPQVDRWDWFADVVTGPAWLGVIIAAVTITLELSFPVAIFVPRVRIVYAAIATSLHVGTYLMFGLDYWAWVATLWLLFVDWSAVTMPKLRRTATVSVAE